MSIRQPLLWGGLIAAAFLTGCTTVHDVTVDAISDRTKPLGSSYHLEVNDPTGGVDPERHAIVVAAVEDALAARGLYAAPSTVRPDMMIQASYGVGHGYVKIVTQQNTDILLGSSGVPRTNSKAVVVFDKTLELTAREALPPPAGSPNVGQPGPELWSVKTKIVDTKQDLLPFVSALASACIDFIGENPGRELTFPVDSSQAQQLLQHRPEAVAK